MYQALAYNSLCYHYRSQHGELSALTSHGDLLWRVNHGTAWHPQASDSAGIASDPLASGQPVVPTLKAMALWVHAIPTVALAVGQATAAVVSEHGRELTSLSLEYPPMQPVQVRFQYDIMHCDFNAGDGRPRCGHRRSTLASFALKLPLMQPVHVKFQADVCWKPATAFCNASHQCM